VLSRFESPKSPLPLAIEIASPEPTIDIFRCSTTICCRDCIAILVGLVIDGDTFQSANDRIRLFGVDTPDSAERCFTDAIEWFRELAGETVRVEFGPRKEDRYGRILCYVYTN